MTKKEYSQMSKIAGEFNLVDSENRISAKRITDLLTNVKLLEKFLKYRESAPFKMYSPVKTPDGYGLVQDFTAGVDDFDNSYYKLVGVLLADGTKKDYDVSLIKSLV